MADSGGKGDESFGPAEALEFIDEMIELLGVVKHTLNHLHWTLRNRFRFRRRFRRRCGWSCGASFRAERRRSLCEDHDKYCRRF